MSKQNKSFPEVLEHSWGVLFHASRPLLPIIWFSEIASNSFPSRLFSYCPFYTWQPENTSLHLPNQNHSTLQTLESFLHTTKGSLEDPGYLSNLVSYHYSLLIPFSSTGLLEVSLNYQVHSFCSISDWMILPQIVIQCAPVFNLSLCSNITSKKPCLTTYLKHTVTLLPPVFMPFLCLVFIHDTHTPWYVMLCCSSVCFFSPPLLLSLPSFPFLLLILLSLSSHPLPIKVPWGALFNSLLYSQSPIPGTS